jgi:hypothetical protein
MHVRKVYKKKWGSQLARVAPFAQHLAAMLLVSFFISAQA